MDRKKLFSSLKYYAPLSVRGWVISVAVLFFATVISLALRLLAPLDAYEPLVFVLAVLVVSLLTDGYFYGILSAFISVFLVNFAFTYPYAKIDFSIYGYPITFITMLAVGCAVSTLTTRLKAQERLRAESEREKLRANLLRAVSHDLRTPLTSIRGSISAVLSGEDSLSREQKHELLKGAEDDAQWLCRMVENLLSVTRISSGSSGAIKKSPEVLEEVLGEAVLKFKKCYPGTELSVFIPEDLLFVPMDAMLIEQLLLNLMENAVIHGSADHISIRAELEADMLRINVADNGRGIAPENLPHLFDGSLRVNGSVSPDASRGMGIGLSVCRAIAQAHGGSIKAANRKEGGALFTLSLSMKEDKDDSKG